MAARWSVPQVTKSMSTLRFGDDVDAELLDRYKRVKAQLDAHQHGRTKHWYCNVEGCNGEPHAGSHWCEHLICAEHGGSSEPPSKDCVVCAAHVSDCRHARAEQCPPASDWFVWMLMAGRGFGKTRSGAEWLSDQACSHEGRAYGVIGRTTEQTREVCIEGESGLLATLGLTVVSKEYNRTTGEIKVPSGSTIYTYTAENPESLRGPNLAGVWCDELAAWHYEETWTHGLIPAVRISTGGERPRVVVTTTPRKTKLMRELLARESTVITRGSTFDNQRNLSAAALLEMERTYHGTRLGKQELYGELLEDVPGALWTPEMIERTRGVLVD
jgi:phage terminase large subunit-like protein